MFIDEEIDTMKHVGDYESTNKVINKKIEMLLKLADLAVNLGKLNDAEWMYLDIITTDRFNLDGWKNYGYLLEKEGKLKPALHAFEQASQLDPSDYEIVEKIESLKEVLDK